MPEDDGKGPDVDEVLDAHEKGGGADSGGSEAADAAVDLEIEGLTDAVEIGVGGFAIVFRAFQPAFQRTVAVKVLTNRDLDDEARRRFERECQTMGSLSEHPNIVTVYGAGFTDIGRPYLVMAYLPGGSLQERIDANGALDWDEATEYGVHLAGALETAHRAKIFHRDIKPGNVLMSQYGDAQLTDFGIARVAGGHETRSGALAVSLAHAPPEVLEGAKPSNAGDVYSLGSSIYEALSGAPPFVGEDNSLRPLLRRILNDPVPDLREKGIPDEICDVLERSMAKDPGDRQPSALRFGIELQEARRILDRDPGRLTVPDMRSHGDDIQFVQAGATPLRSKGAVFDMAKPGSALLTETTDMATAASQQQAAAKSRSALIAALVAGVLLIGAVVAVLATRSSSTNVAGPAGNTSATAAPLPPETVPVTLYTDRSQTLFLDACTRAGNPLDACRCVYDDVKARIPFGKFVQISDEVRKGTPIAETEIQPSVEKCTAPPTTAAPPPS